MLFLIVGLSLAALGVAGNVCPPVPSIWNKVFDSPHYSEFSNLVQATYTCPPADDNLTIFAIHDDFFSTVPMDDPIFTDSAHRELVLGLHIIKRKVNGKQLVWQDQPTMTPCGRVRALSRGSRSPMLGLFGVGGSTHSFSASPSVVNGVHLETDVMETEMGIVHQVDAFIEPQGEQPTHIKPGATLPELPGTIEGHLSCPTTATKMSSCSCCPNAPRQLGDACASLSDEIIFSFSRPGSCDDKTELDKLQTAWETALDLAEGSVSIELESCEDFEVGGAAKFHTTARVSRILARLAGTRGSNQARFIRRVMAVLADPDSNTRLAQRINAVIAEVGYEFLTAVLNSEAWDTWSSWGPCQATCGQGVQTRTRTCKIGTCPGASTQDQACNAAWACEEVPIVIGDHFDNPTWSVFGQIATGNLPGALAPTNVKAFGAFSGGWSCSGAWKDYPNQKPGYKWIIEGRAQHQSNDALQGTNFGLWKIEAYTDSGFGTKIVEQDGAPAVTASTPTNTWITQRAAVEPGQGTGLRAVLVMCQPPGNAAGSAWFDAFNLYEVAPLDPLPGQV